MLSQLVAFNMKNQTTITSLMEVLSNLYEQSSTANKVHLMKKLFFLHMLENKSFKFYLNQFNEIMDQLRSQDIKFNEEVQALPLLGQLLDNQDNVVTSINAFYGKNLMKLAKVCEMFMTEEIRRIKLGASNSRSTLNIDSGDRNNNRKDGQRSRSKSRNGRSKSKNPNNNNLQNNKKDVKYQNCGKRGHYQSRCKELKKENDNKNAANVVSDELDDALICLMENKMEAWVLNSGSSFHATLGKELYENYVQSNLGNVYLGDNQPYDVVRKGSVRIKLHGSVLRLDNLSHVLDLRKNLISVRQLEADRYVTSFAYDSWKILRGAMTVARGKKTSTLYMTIEEKITVQDDFVTCDNTNVQDNATAQGSADLPIQLVPVIRSIKLRVLNTKYLNFLLLIDRGKLKSYGKAYQVDDVSQWELVMQDEIRMLVSNQTQELTKLAMEKGLYKTNGYLQSRRIKHDGLKKYKARLMVKGFHQKVGIDYIEIFSLVVRLTTIRIVLSIVAAKGLHLEQMDVKTAFLHGDLEEEIYMQQLEGYVEKGRKH